MNTLNRSRSEAAGSWPLAFVVDDDCQVRTYVQNVLEKQHYSVIAFADPSNALKALIGLEGHISILISDVEMPEMNGIALAHEAIRRFSELPVLMISGRHDIENRDPTLPFLPKPFLPRTLTVAVERAIAIGRPPRSTAIHGSGDGDRALPTLARH